MKNVEETDNIKDTELSNLKKKVKIEKKKTKNKKKKKDEYTESLFEKEEKDDTVDQFTINNKYVLIKMLGSGSFGEIHLAYDKTEKVEKNDKFDKKLYAIKFEMANAKNPQLKHEYNILECLNRPEIDLVPIGVPKVYSFDKMEGKCNYMIMDFLGPTLSDLFQFMNKKFSYQTVFLIAIQMLQRIEYVHSKGFIHRDIKPENFLIGLHEQSNLLHIIDFGLSRRYKDRVSLQHIPYRENRHLVGTARYASINAHLGIEQSRRDDLESIGYVLTYFINGRLPWQSKYEKGKYPKIGEKKLSTPPEVLCKKLPLEFCYYFHYCKNLRFDDKPDYAMLRNMFLELLMQNTHVNTEFTFDWFQEEEEDEQDESQGINFFENKDNKDSKNLTPEPFDFKRKESNKNKEKKEDILEEQSRRIADLINREKDVKQEEAKKNANKSEFNLNFGNVLKNKNNDNVIDFNSSEEDSPGNDESDEEVTIRKDDKILDDEEFKRILVGSNKQIEKVQISKKTSISNDRKEPSVNQIGIPISTESNYNLLGNSSNKSKQSPKPNELEIVLKNNTGSTSSRLKDSGKNVTNNKNDFIAEINPKNDSSTN